MRSLRLMAVLTLMLGAAACSASSGSGAFRAAPMLPSALAKLQHAYTISHLRVHLMPLRGKRIRLAATPVVYPADLARGTGKVVTAAASYDIYVNCSNPSACWGQVQGFLTNLSGSSFAGLLKQYTGANPSAYTFGGSSNVQWPNYSEIGENDLLAIVHQVAAATQQTGYGTIYHVFLPKGVDTCFDYSASCYSPDYRPTFAFCAYHSSVTFSDIGHVLYSVEPYQNVNGCSTSASKGASKLTNSTASTLGHELFESITDPDPNSGWFNNTFGDEIADLCETYLASVTLGGTQYLLQPMYSNKVHGCTV